MRFLTDFADQAVVLPLVLVVALALLLLGWRRGAVAWLLVLAGTLGTILVLKLLLTACADTLGLPLLHTPSGHTAAAGVVAGGLTVVVARSRRWAMPVAVFAAVMIGVSRLVLGLHTLPEVLVGGAIGLAGVAALLALAGDPPPPRRVGWVAAGIVAVFLLFHGQHLNAESRIRHAAFDVAWLVAACHPAQARP